MVYIAWIKNKVAQYISKRLIMELCLEERIGGGNRRGWA